MEDIIKGFKDGLKPVERLTVSEWADKNRILSPIASSEAGKWRTSRTPYLKKPMDCLSNYSTYEKVICMKGAQGGWTEMGNNWIGYIIDNSPAPTLMVQPTDETVRRNSKMRIDPMIQASISLSKKVSKQKSKSGENTITQKNFAGGILLMVGANSPVGLRSVPIKNLFLDEVDGYPYDLDGEGSPIDLAIARTRTFPKRKIFIISTPTDISSSVVNKEFQKTDQNYYNVPCPHCGEFHILEFNNLQWNEGDYNNVFMICPNCNEKIEERYKTQMFASGDWFPKYPERSNSKVIGFHWSSFYSPLGWFSWKEIAQAYDDAKTDNSKMKTFINTILGEPIEESGERPEWEAIYNKREKYKLNEVPYNVCFLTCGVDVQKDRIELEIVGWCSDKSSYSIDYRVLDGNTTNKEVWNNLSDIVKETWMREDGQELQIRKMCVDSGYNTSEVHSWCRTQSHDRVIPIKGLHNANLAVSPPKNIDYDKKGKKIGRLKQWNIGVSLLKSELYSWLTLDVIDGNIPANYCHFPEYDSNYFQGLASEEYITAKKQWKKIFNRNEPLDCRIYARAGSIIVGLDRMRKEQLEAMAGIKLDKKERSIEKNTNKIKKNRDSIW